jgi:hypothetical protein
MGGYKRGRRAQTILVAAVSRAEHRVPLLSQQVRWSFLKRTIAMKNEAQSEIEYWIDK